MLLLSTEQIEFEGFIRRRLTLERDSGRTPIVIDFDLIGAEDIPSPQALDGYLPAVLHYAMSIEEPLRMKGIVSRQTLHNLAEFQTITASFYPKAFRTIEVSADEIVDRVPTTTEYRAISLFSGGVNSTFTLLRHQPDVVGVGTLPIRNVVMIHHQELNNPTDFVVRRLERFAPLLEDLGVEIVVQRTTLRQVMHERKVKYLPTHGAQLSASLQQYSHAFRIGFLGSTEPARAPVIPYGSTPATDWLFSTPQMQIFHDGSGFSRNEKVELIAAHPIACRILHVCLNHPFENCGICKKCVRTYLNFLALGIDRPQCMPGTLDINLIDEIPLAPHDRNEFRLILDYAELKGIQGAWRDRVKRRVSRDAECPTVPAPSFAAVVKHGMEKLLHTGKR